VSICTYGYTDDGSYTSDNTLRWREQERRSGGGQTEGEDCEWRIVAQYGRLGLAATVIHTQEPCALCLTESECIHSQ